MGGMNFVFFGAGAIYGGSLPANWRIRHFFHIPKAIKVVAVRNSVCGAVFCLGLTLNCRFVVWRHEEKATAHRATR
jgi:hypothetical protein